jgi:hypothetical protein
VSGTFESAMIWSAVPEFEGQRDLRVVGNERDGRAATLRERVEVLRLVRLALEVLPDEIGKHGGEGVVLGAGRQRDRGRSAHQSPSGPLVSTAVIPIFSS